ncbi:hypothetical protein AMATHDRAFT_87489 [Amanita thiersii Skay4041]|uniref:Uncharacterized protein n=1 Tax=Amanita thiersii Skay4041 TaxID=703135 RepID=A0A2A9NHR5_9AGAR|nr:hypothetical protein AMATHDRAFT_87489 [Amanita thiersii Skay4041]
MSLSPNPHHSSRSPTPPIPRSPSIVPLKRKEPSNATERTGRHFSPPSPLPPGPSSPHQGEYEKGRVICEVCSASVSFRDEATGGFTLKHWDAHRLTCSALGQSSTEPVIYTPESTAEALAHPPTKRRRAKRTEEERIDYLRADPYVAQFEAYRVLCASCDKWIRLRPNSTYCSIPWDAHRKSCLAKKVKNVYALEERNTLFSKDPDIRKFDAERVLCAMCDKWLSLNPDDHLQAVQKWLQHRAACQKATTTSSASGNCLTSSESVSVAPPPTEQQMALTAGASPNNTSNNNASNNNNLHHHHRISHHQHHSHSASPTSPKPGTSFSQNYHNGRSQNSDPSSFHDLNPSNFAPPHESRRRNAEQRAATLRADSLIGEVEPNRVFCSLCQKWVQLRQDSSYCAYPWLQHRGKCLARHQRRAQKAAEVADGRNSRKFSMAEEEDELMSDNDMASSDGESDEGVVIIGESSHADERFRSRDSRKVDRHNSDHPMTGAPPPPPSHHQMGHHNHHHHHHRQQHHHQHQQRASAVVKGRMSGSGYHYPGQGRYSHGGSGGGAGGGQSSPYRHDPRGGGGGGSNAYPTYTQRASRVWDDDDMDGDEDDGEGEGVSMPIDDECMGGGPSRSGGGGAHHHHHHHHQHQQQQHCGAGGGSGGSTVRRPWPVGLADLDSLPGRREFVLSSIEYLFRTTYETTDDMTISTLLLYLNAAMPQDKHEDFDTAEVTKTAAFWHEKGRVVFEGDVIRLAD